MGSRIVWIVITNCSRFGDLLLMMLLGFGCLLDEVVKAGELEFPLLLDVRPGVEVEVAPLGIEELPVPGEGALVRGPSFDHGEGGGLVVEAEMPPSVVDALQTVIGATRVHRNLAKHAEQSPSIRLPLGLEKKKIFSNNLMTGTNSHLSDLCS